MKCEKTDDFFVMRVQISVDLSREQRGKSAVFSPSERVQFRFHLASQAKPKLATFIMPQAARKSKRFRDFFEARTKRTEQVKKKDEKP